MHLIIRDAWLAESCAIHLSVPRVVRPVRTCILRRWCRVYRRIPKKFLTAAENLPAQQLARAATAAPCGTVGAGNGNMPRASAQR